MFAVCAHVQSPQNMFGMCSTAPCCIGEFLLMLLQEHTNKSKHLVKAHRTHRDSSYIVTIVVADHHAYRDRISINEYLTSAYQYLIHDFIHLSYRDCCIIVNVIFVTGTNWAKDHQLAPYNEIVYFAKHYSVLYSDLCVASPQS